VSKANGLGCPTAARVFVYTKTYLAFHKDNDIFQTGKTSGDLYTII